MGCIVSVLDGLRRLLVGRRLRMSIERNSEAARRLDLADREMIER